MRRSNSFSSSRLISLFLSIMLILTVSMCVAQRKIPLLIQYQGKLIKDNAPLTTPQKIRIKIIEGGNESEKQTSGTVLYSETRAITPDASGNYSVLLGENPDPRQHFTPDKFLSSNNLFIEITHFVKNKPEVVLPRQQVVSLAFALQSMKDQKAAEASHADEAAHAVKADNAVYAASAGKATTADNAAVADRAMNADKAQLADRATVSEKASVAEKALNADHAKLSDYASQADRAASAIKADEATKAQLADRASIADKAVAAEKAASADRAQLADRAMIADKATLAEKANTSTKADEALHAQHALKADEAIKAQTADRATKAAMADKATQADNATNADNARNAVMAQTAGDANEAMNARHANRADTSLHALRLGGKREEDFITRPLQKNDFEKEIVTSDIIARNAITTIHIKDGSITGAKIARGSITGNMIKDGSIPQSKLQPTASARKLRQPGQPPQIDSVDVTGNLSVSGNLFHRYGTLYTPLIRSDGYIFSRFLSADGINFAVKGSVTGTNATAVEGNVQSTLGVAFLASGFGDLFRAQRVPQLSTDPITYRISNRADVEIRNSANKLIYNFIADSIHPTLTIGGQSGAGTVIMPNALGQEGIRLAGGDGKNSAALNIQGTITVKGKELMVNDYAEVFELDKKNELQPGYIVVIDDEAPGRLRLATKSYDKSVAGVISGGDVSSPGVMLGVREDGSTDKPVALAGRVYCYADAAFGEINPGDLLTTSSTPGHAMRVNDYAAAQGAVIGKAMQGLKSDRGKIMILVTLQ